jgi:tRNA nucleotidyltransferase (CCA-adding enzyme)
MTSSALQALIRLYRPLVDEISKAGGKFIFVGGCVRDALMGQTSKDFDAEIFGLQPHELESILGKFGPLQLVGKIYGVYKIHGLDLDISIPRRDYKTGKGYKGFDVKLDPFMTFEDCARRRDLTMNSMGYDPITQTLLDPFLGVQDLKDKLLRPTDPATFPEDPLRGLRVAQFAARFLMAPTSDLYPLCQELDLSELPAERIQIEFEKILVKGIRPSLAFEFLQKSTLIRFFPEIAALQNVPQNPKWHPEGDVWTHTLMVLDYAAKHPPKSRQFMLALAALCHDLGKPIVTHVLDNGRLTAQNHEKAGIAPARSFLKRLKISSKFQRPILALIYYHLIPIQFAQTKPSAYEYRKLAYRLLHEGTSLEDLSWLSRSDSMGRTTEEALQDVCPDVDFFLEEAHKAGALDPKDFKEVVQGKHLIAHGYTPGPSFQELLATCRDIQYKTGVKDVNFLIDQLEKEKISFKNKKKR